MRGDTGAHRFGPHYAAYIEHLKNCVECGQKRCPAGAELCADYLASTRTLSVEGTDGPRHGSEVDEEESQ